MPPIIKDDWEIAIMRQAGRLVAQVLKLTSEMAKPGVSTADLDKAAEKFIVEAGASPTFKGYRGFPASLCTSVNEEVVHGIPSAKRILKEGDILKIDAGVTYKQYVGDAAISVPVGKVTPQAQALIDATRGALESAIAVLKPGCKLSDVGRAVQSYAESRGYSVVKNWGGHGIGQQLHEDPHVPNYVNKHTLQSDMKLKPGLVICIEPMLNAGTDETKILRDNWTVVTIDGKLSAHFEHTIALTKEGAEILTLP